MSKIQHTTLWTKRVIGGYLFLLLVCFPALSHGASGCGDFLPTFINYTTIHIPYTETYHNCRFQYRVSIPEGFIGRSDPPPSPSHGIGILLSRLPDGYIYVGAEYNSIEWESSDQGASRHVEWIKEDVQQIISVQYQHVTVDTHPSTRMIVTYLCPNGITMGEDMFLLVNPGMVYELSLMADATTYREYKRLLERIVKTFRVEQPCE